MDIVITMSGRASVDPIFFSGQYLLSDYFHIAYTHHLEGLDVPFEGYHI